MDNLKAYHGSDLARFVDEPAKRPGRTEFARDRARILHSSALRRLAAKTQVAQPWINDFPRTRLSHSLECAQVGRELGAALGADPDLVESACLAHDLGHPPFGHNGESALAEIARECGGFEGNAQSFRILTRLEPKTLDSNGRSAGLNLARATLDSAIKYPWPSAENSQKFGLYDDDAEIFAWVKNGVIGERTPLEAQVMDWADDVAYSVHDFEDSVQAGQIIIGNLESDLPSFYEVAKEDYLPDLTVDELSAALARLRGLSCWPVSFDGSHNSLARLKDLTSQLIGRFAQGAERATRERFGNGALSRYSAELIVPRHERVEVALLKSFVAHYIFRSEQSQERYLHERALIHRLAEGLLESDGRLLERHLASPWLEADSRGRLRIVVDQIASLTDPAVPLLLARITND
jgi:dGTPase